MTSSPETVANSAPSATVGLAPLSPPPPPPSPPPRRRPMPTRDTVTLTYVWKVNGTTRKTTATTAPDRHLRPLRRRQRRRGRRRQSVEVTPTDGTVNGTLVSSQVTVAASRSRSTRATSSPARSPTRGAAPPPAAPTRSQGTVADFDTNGATGTIALPTAARQPLGRPRLRLGTRRRSELPRRHRQGARGRVDRGPTASSGASTPPTSTAQSCASRPAAASSSRPARSSTTPRPRSARKSGSRASPPRPAPFIRVRVAVQGHQPDHDPDARLGRRHDRADHLAVHRHQLAPPPSRSPAASASAATSAAAPPTLRSRRPSTISPRPRSRARTRRRSWIR